jgi:hypothetical protein
MTMFSPAQRTETRLRLAIDGVSGSGKSFTSLAIATGLGGPIAAIDTERGRLSELAGIFQFQHCRLSGHKAQDYIAAANEAAKLGAKVLVIDSLSHAWEELCTEMEQLANARFSGNSMRAWGVGKPKNRQFVDALFAFPGHLICTMRSAIEYAIEPDDRGRTQIRKVGLKPKQDRDIEYEFTMYASITREHKLTIEKGPGKFQDRVIEKPTPQLGKELLAWLNDASGVATITAPADERPDRKKLDSLIEQHNIGDAMIMGWYEHFGVRSLTELNDEQLSKLTAKVAAKYATTTAA